jgi:branched-chain amino acid transport system ATP-binding protein
MTMLEVRNITKRFDNLVAVKDVSMSVKRGELRAIIGPNGAGKTTFFNMISGYFAPTKGSILFEGKDVTQIPAHLRVGLGMGRTFQITEIFPELTVHENVLTAAEVAAGQTLQMVPSRAAAKLTNEVAAEMLELVGLTAKADRLVSELAHGDQRTTEIAMALAQLPRLLLLDEPTAGMGDQETYEITALIRRLHRERNYTIVLIEHDMRVVFHLADYITVLDQGNLLAEGTPKQIAVSEAVQAAYLGETG